MTFEKKENMKNILILIALVIFASCSSEDSKEDQLGKFEGIKLILPQGEWKVGKFIKDEVDQTANFESFVFTFNKDGNVLAQNDLFSENGTWLYVKETDLKENLVLTFGQIEPLDEISDDWQIVSIGASKIELIDKGSNPKDTKLLSFLKL